MAIDVVLPRLNSYRFHRISAMLYIIHQDNESPVMAVFPSDGTLAVSRSDSFVSATIAKPRLPCSRYSVSSMDAEDHADLDFRLPEVHDGGFYSSVYRFFQRLFEEFHFLLPGGYQKIFPTPISFFLP